MSPSQDFALNHIATPKLRFAEFVELARGLGINQVEIRNDLPGVEIADGTDPAEVRAAAQAGRAHHPDDQRTLPIRCLECRTRGEGRTTGRLCRRLRGQGAGTLPAQLDRGCALADGARTPTCGPRCRRCCRSEEHGLRAWSSRSGSRSAHCGPSVRPSTRSMSSAGRRGSRCCTIRSTITWPASRNTSLSAPGWSTSRASRTPASP